MIEVTRKEEVAAGKADLEADYFHVAYKGSFEIFLAMGAPEAQVAEKAVSMTQSERVGTVPKGGSLGELVLLYFAPRSMRLSPRNSPSSCRRRSGT